jgi:hypothetical protein
MKKELKTHFTFVIAFFIFISLFRGWFELIYLSFWAGGLIGTILPDIDHLIYVYYLRPQEVTSQKIVSLISKRESLASLTLLADTRSERKHLIFHTFHFNLIFILLSYLILTSSGSLLGRGIVLAFSLHLLLDQIVDLMETGDLANWLRQVNISLSLEQKRYYLIGNTLVLLFFGFLL